MNSCVNLCFSTKDSGTHRAWKYATFLNFTKSSTSFVSFFSRHPKTFSTFFSENFFASYSSPVSDGHRSDSHATFFASPPKAIIRASSSSASKGCCCCCSSSSRVFFVVASIASFSSSSSFVSSLNTWLQNFSSRFGFLRIVVVVACASAAAGGLLKDPPPPPPLCKSGDDDDCGFFTSLPLFVFISCGVSSMSFGVWSSVSPAVSRHPFAFSSASSAVDGKWCGNADRKMSSSAGHF